MYLYLFSSHYPKLTALKYFSNTFTLFQRNIFNMFILYKNSFSKSSIFYKKVLCKSFCLSVHLWKPVDNVDNFVDSLFIALFRHYFIHNIYVTLLHNFILTFLCAQYDCSQKTQLSLISQAFGLVCHFVIILLFYFKCYKILCFHNLNKF